MILYRVVYKVNYNRSLDERVTVYLYSEQLFESPEEAAEWFEGYQRTIAFDCGQKSTSSVMGLEKINV